MHLTILSKRQSVSCLPSEEVRVSVGCLNTSRGSAVDCEVKSMVGVREKVCGGGTSELPSALESVDTNKNTIHLIKDTGNAIPESYST